MGRGGLGLGVYVLGRPWPRARNLYKILAPGSGMKNPLAARYTTTTPYKLGPSAVRYGVTSRDAPQSPAGGSSQDFLREAMVEQLKNPDAHFDFMIKFQTDPVKMPVEDSTVAWDVRVSPFIKVATIRIPKQVFDSDRQIEFAETLSFNPWHSLPEHQPIGGMNRIRKAVYGEMSRFRHDMNGVPRREPAGWKDFD